MPSSDHRPTLMPSVQGAADALGQLVAGHLKLAQLEFMLDARKLAKRIVLTGCFFVLSVIGYIFVVGGVTALVYPTCGWATALLTAGLLQLVAGALGVALTVARRNSLVLLSGSTREMRHSMAEILMNDNNSSGGR